MKKVFNKIDAKGTILGFVKTKPFVASSTDKNSPIKTSYLGTAVFYNFKIKPFNYETLAGERIEIKKGIVIDTVLFSVSQSKNIVTTPIQGRDGTVKEYISMGDYSISIEGKIVSRNNDYPADEVNELIQILNSPVSIKIISEFLSFFGIHESVVENYDFPQMEGFRNTQEFSISLLSDTPVELQTDEF